VVAGVRAGAAEFGVGAVDVVLWHGLAPATLKMKVVGSFMSFQTPSMPVAM
jgi:hypothetical protein